MKHFTCSLTGPVGLLIVFATVALLFGVDPWHLARTTVICLPTAAYVVISVALLLLTGQGRRRFWHAQSLALYVMLTAAGFWSLVATGQLQRWLAGAL
jgi:hypothetical protein